MLDETSKQGYPRLPKLEMRRTFSFRLGSNGHENETIYDTRLVVTTGLQDPHFDKKPGLLVRSLFGDFIGARCSRKILTFQEDVFGEKMLLDISSI